MMLPAGFTIDRFLGGHGPYLGQLLLLMAIWLTHVATYSRPLRMAKSSCPIRKLCDVSVRSRRAKINKDPTAGVCRSLTLRDKERKKKKRSDECVVGTVDVRARFCGDLIRADTQEAAFDAWPSAAAFPCQSAPSKCQPSSAP